MYTNILKRLAGQTAIYGLSSIIGRLLNYLLVPIYTRVFLPEEYGIVTELYGYVGFFIIIFTYGMETAFFRYVKEKVEANKVLSTALLSLIFSTVFFASLLILFAQPIANLIGYPQNSEYIIWLTLILAFDTLSAIPFAHLRYQEKPIRFATIKLLNIFTAIILILFFVKGCPMWVADYPFLHTIYDPTIGVGYIFLGNLAASLLTIILLLPDFKSVTWTFDKVLWKKMMGYALPLVLVGFAGIINEMLDRVLLKHLLPYDLTTNMAKLGIYGACYKLSILMTLFIQAFRFAGEPFFFAQSSQSNAKEVYAMVMKYFVAFLGLVFLGVTVFLDIAKYFIGTNYHEGLVVVPILLLANLFLGIYYNLSMWYKLTNKTIIGAYIAIFGAAITVALNVLLIPSMGYVGSAWATLICYVLMVGISYVLCQKYYPIPYNVQAIGQYLLVAIALFFVDKQLTVIFEQNSMVLLYSVKVFLIGLYVGWVFWKEKRTVKFR